MSATIDDIRNAYEEEQRLGTKAVEAGDVPGTYGAITARWLTNILCKDVAGAEVVAFTQGEKDDGSSSRRRLFLTYNEAGQRAGLPATVFCKAAEELKSRIMLGMAGTAEGEVNFFNKLRRRVDIEAPETYHAAFDPRSCAYIVVMKDLADRASFCDEDSVVDRDKAVTQVELLATLHGTFYEHPDLGTDAIPYRHWPDFWDNMLTHSTGWEIACDRAFAQAKDVIPPRLFKRQSEIWAATQASVECQRHLPRTVTHCDVHLKNWYITKQGRMGLGDWQIVTIGHWSRDLIYAMSTSLEIEDRRAWQDELLRIYVDKMASFGVPRISRDEALLYCRQQLFTALAFWTITLVPAPGMPAMQPEKTTYKFIERLAAAIDDLDALDSFK